VNNAGSKSRKLSVIAGLLPLSKRAQMLYCCDIGGNATIRRPAELPAAKHQLCLAHLIAICVASA
jgi:hypothetical protein